ncbi:copper resistance protein NlpE [Flavobacterium zhairuonense]|uniref:copper resistance protein NlpE N-terminal domain-containing protein n=1 Tax=Flavobacterium zhairuonense TaxID=2493631 RepID=UPI0010479A33|nr:copper resistance protein NlpE N-terminal domain-containing protein [Flavobacterium zhairuonense]KAF2516238.1 copper resistance protein NlpE [Flavobacterium zhairuonense]
MKNGFVLMLLAMQLISCNSKVKQEENKIIALDSLNAKIDEKLKENVLIYEGMLPCADCSGIQTVLKIDSGNGTMEGQKFEISSIYKGKSSEKEFIEKGNFNTERGLENDQNGTIFILNWDKPVEKQIYYGYLSSDTTKIYMLDRDKKIIKSELNYSLTLKK